MEDDMGGVRAIYVRE